MGGHARQAGEWPELLGKALLQGAVQHAIENSPEILSAGALGGGLRDHAAVEVTEMMAPKLAKVLALKADRLDVMSGGAGLRCQMPQVRFFGKVRFSGSLMRS